jgi:hypothetical protein
VGPTHYTIRLQRPPPLQLLLFVFFLLCYVIVFLFLLLLLFLCNFFMSLLTSDHPSTVQFQFSATRLVQQPLHSSCCRHNNGLFIEFGCLNRNGLFIEFYCIQNRVARPWERPGGPCLVFAIAHRLVLLNQIQILLFRCFYFLVLLLGLTACLLAVSQRVGCLIFFKKKKLLSYSVVKNFLEAIKLYVIYLYY